MAIKVVRNIQVRKEVITATFSKFKNGHVRVKAKGKPTILVHPTGPYYFRAVAIGTRCDAWGTTKPEQAFQIVARIVW